MPREPIYNYDLDELQQELKQVEKALYERVDRLLPDDVESFYIGKTYLVAREGQNFDLHHQNTWNEPKIVQNLRKRKHAVVFAIINQENMPQHHDGPMVTEEQYTIALRQRLLQHYVLIKRNQKIDYESFGTGATDGNASPAYVLYLTYSTQSLVSQNPGSALEEASDNEPEGTGNDRSDDSDTNQTHPEGNTGNDTVIDIQLAELCISK